jgi:hypothetical protein
MSRPKKSVLPPLPQRVFSVLGAWDVEETTSIDPTGTQLKADETAAGLADFATRKIQIDSEYNAIGKWRLLGHEAAHVWLNDSGADESLTSEQEEHVCNAFGTWFAAAVKAGYLVVDDSKA